MTFAKTCLTSDGYSFAPKCRLITYGGKDNTKVLKFVHLIRIINNY